MLHPALYMRGCPVERYVIPDEFGNVVTEKDKLGWCQKKFKTRQCNLSECLRPN